MLELRNNVQWAKLKKKKWKGGGIMGWTMSYAVLSVIAQLCATPWAAVRQDPLSLGILQARILEWVATPSFRESSQPRDQTQVSCTANDSLSTELPGKPHYVLM